jgi:hypothetical protein
MRSKVLNRIPTAGNARSVRQALKQGPSGALDEMRSLVGDSGDVLLSNESLYQASPEYLAAVADLLAGLGVQPKVLVFFRPQVDWLVSSYLQHLKASKNRATLTEDAFALHRHKKDHTNWLRLARNLESAFGRDNLHACWYPAALRGPGVGAAAFDWLGLSPPPAIQDIEVNPSPTREAAAVLRMANAASIGGQKFADAFLAAAAARRIVGTKVTLSEGVIRKIEAETKESNVALLQRYCPHLVPEEELAPAVVNPRQFDDMSFEELKRVAMDVAVAGGNSRHAAARAFGISPTGFPSLRDGAVTAFAGLLRKIRMLP